MLTASTSAGCHARTETPLVESVPSGADAVTMKSTIHDWDDERSVVILKNCRQALPLGGRLLLVLGSLLSPPKVAGNGSDGSWNKVVCELPHK